jgi:hypothetical protein
MSELIWKDASAQALLQDFALSETWDRLNKERSDLPFLSSLAVLPALKVFGQGDERLLTAHDGGRCVAMLLLRDVGKLRWQTFQPSQLPLGVWVAAASLRSVRKCRRLGMVNPSGWWWVGNGECQCTEIREFRRVQGVRNAANPGKHAVLN